MASYIVIPRNIPSAAAALIGLAMTVMGTVVTFNPRAGIKMWEFQLPAKASSASELATESLILDELRLFAVREYGVGASLLAATLLGEQKVAGAILMLGVPIAIVDGIVQRRQTGKGQWVHWGLAPLLAGIGIALWRK